MKPLKKSLVIGWVLVFFIGFIVLPESEAAEKKEIQFYTTPPGSVIHSIATAMCDMLKKHSSWLTGTVEVAWGIDALKLMVRDPARKKTGVANMMPVNLWEAERLGLLKDIKMMVVMKLITNNQFWVTFDPDIKKASDFAGKRVSVGKKGTGLALGAEYLFKELGIYDKVKLSYLDFDGSASAFSDRTVDAAWATATIGREKGIVVPAFMSIALSDKTFHFVGVEQKAVDAVRTKTGYPLFTAMMPKGVMGKNQPAPLLTLEMEAIWFVTPEFDPEAVTELIRVMWENFGDLAKYVKATSLLTKEDLPLTSFTASAYHPASIKFFNEKKVKVGR